MPLSSNTSGCPVCVVMPSAFSLSQVIWYNSTVGLPLDTVSIVLSQYNNTVLTSTTTVHGDLASLSGTTLPQAVAVESKINNEFNISDYFSLGQDWYGKLVNYVLGGTTSGTAINTLNYPTPYMAIAGIVLWTSYSDITCDQHATEPNQFYCNTCYLNGDTFLVYENNKVAPNVNVIRSRFVPLNTTFYAPLPYPSNYPTGVVERLALYTSTMQLPLSSFMDFISSDTQLLKSIPMLASCSYVSYAFGPPALKIPVSALTATVTATTTGSGLYPLGNKPTPANAIEPPIGPPTTTQLVPSPTPTNSGSSYQASPDDQSSSTQGSTNQGPPDQYAPEKGSPTKGSPSSPSTAVNPFTQGGGEASQPLQSQNDNGLQEPSYSSSNQAPEEGTTTSGANSVGSQQQPPLGQAEAGPALSYAGNTVQPDASTQYDLPGIGKVLPGGPPITTASVIYSLAPSGSALISNGIPVEINTVADVPEPSQQPVILTVGGNGFTADASSNFLIEGQTLVPGITATTLSGTPINLAAGASQAMVGGSIVAVAPADNTPALGAENVPALTFAGSTYSANSLGQLVVGEQTLWPGAAITVSGTQISLAASGNTAVIGSSTELLALNSAITAAVLTFDGSTFPPETSSEFNIGGQIVAPGGSIEVSGTPISYPDGASAIVLGTNSLPPSFDTIGSGVQPLITFDGSTFTADASSDFTVNGQTLTPGSNIDVSGTPISYPSAGTAVGTGTSTTHLSFATFTGSNTPAITFAGSTYTADASSDFIINSQTLSPGGAVTIGGTPVSYAAAGTDVVIGTSTEAVGIGTLIMSGLGNGPSNPANTSSVQFTGDAISRNEAAKGGLMMLSGVLVWAVA